MLVSVILVGRGRSSLSGLVPISFDSALSDSYLTVQASHISSEIFTRAVTCMSCTVWQRGWLSQLITMRPVLSESTRPPDKSSDKRLGKPCEDFSRIRSTSCPLASCTPIYTSIIALSRLRDLFVGLAKPGEASSWPRKIDADEQELDSATFS